MNFETPFLNEFRNASFHSSIMPSDMSENESRLNQAPSNRILFQSQKLSKTHRSPVESSNSYELDIDGVVSRVLGNDDGLHRSSSRNSGSSRSTQRRSRSSSNIKSDRKSHRTPSELSPELKIATLLKQLKKPPLHPETSTHRLKHSHQRDHRKEHSSHRSSPEPSWLHSNSETRRSSKNDQQHGNNQPHNSETYPIQSNYCQSTNKCANSTLHSESRKTEAKLPLESNRHRRDHASSRGNRSEESSEYNIFRHENLSNTSSNKYSSSRKSRDYSSSGVPQSRSTGAFERSQRRTGTANRLNPCQERLSSASIENLSTVASIQSRAMMHCPICNSPWRRKLLIAFEVFKAVCAVVAMIFLGCIAYLKYSNKCSFYASY